MLSLASPSPGADRAYLAGLIARAEAQELHSQPYWKILLHYQASLFGEASLIDDARFFLAADGKQNPRSELAATLRAMFEPSGDGDEAVRCRFPARHAWLSERLEIDEKRLPPAVCTEFDEALAKVQPRSAVLIFPGTHNNSPASMFGHTLINIEGPYKSKLLSYAVNYAAFTDESNGFAYAVKGIFGLYRGYFSVLPYYQKVKEYADLERRDVWEYQLNLDAAETRRMFLHIWELRDIYSDYYFFDENCAYQLLFLLEAARPSAKLTDHCRPWVIPIDTVRIVSEAGLVEEVFYRPSKATRIARTASLMSPDEQKLALRVIDGSLAPQGLEDLELSREGRIRVLDLVSETVEYSYFKSELSRDAYRRSYLALLKERSRLGAAVDEEGQWPVPTRPDLGHGSNRLSLGIGAWKDEFYQELKIRPAYHNLLDGDAGYVAGSQIDFGDLVLRYYPRRSKGELHALTLIDIVSLSPRNRFFKPVSWKVKTGFAQRTFSDGGDHLVYELNPGGGFCYGNDAGLGYLMFETELLVGGRFQDSFALGAGGAAGLAITIGDLWKVNLAAKRLWYEAGERHRLLEVKLEQALVTGRNSSLNLGLSRQKVFGRYASEAGLSWNLFW